MPAAFLRAGLVDEGLVYVAPLLLGSSAYPAVGELGIGTMADALRLEFRDAQRLGDDWLFIATRGLEKEA